MTSQVIAGTYQLTNIPVNGSRDLEVRIKVKAGTAAGATTSALVTGTSTHDPTKVDAVKAKVRALA